MSAGQPSVLIYAGLHRGNGFAKRCRRYDLAIGFEPNPELYEFCRDRFAAQDNVRIVHAALADTNGTVRLNVSSNDGRSSSLGLFDPNWGNHVQMARAVDVPAVQLDDFCRDERIREVHDYISDLQGMDLTVLKSIRPMLDARRIGSVQCEVTKDNYRNVYHDLPSNRRAEFDALLAPNYIPVSTGWGTLYEGVFESVPESWWEYDCRWSLDCQMLRARLALRRHTGVGPAIAWLRMQKRQAKRRRARKQRAA
jgi:FkbM family methyltransferase